MQRNRGFTLIELSIVLVIIGLLVGGVLVGRDLIKAAEIRQGISQIEKYNTAVNTFQGKYNCLPGDCPNATNFWPVNPSGCPPWYIGAPPYTGVCNGNGDGQIANIEEQRSFWYDLHVAGYAPFIPSATNGIPFVIDFTNPSFPYHSPFTSSAYGITGIAISSSPQFYNWCSFGTCLGGNYAQVPGQQWIIGAPDGAGSGTTPSVPSAAAFAIDSKIDDGEGLTGTVIHACIEGALIVDYADGTHGCYMVIRANF